MDNVRSKLPRSYLKSATPMGVYQPLESRHVRLIRLIKPDDNPPLLVDGGGSPGLAYELQTFRLDSCPTYNALSYTWGDPSPAHTISVNGQPVATAANLHAALERLATVGHDWFWTDALCINQRDVAEKNRQVRMMHEIYSQASGVLIFLRQTGSDAKLAVQTIRQWARAAEPIVHRLWRDLRSPVKIAMAEPSPWLDHAVARLPAHLTDRACWEAVNHLLQNPYFKRIWVQQEMASARVAWLLCGQHECDLNDVVIAYAFWRAVFKRSDGAGAQQPRYPQFAHALSLGTADAMLNLYTFITALHHRDNTPASDPLNIVLSSRYKQASEPCDKIYGCLALFPASDGIDVPIKYELSAAQVYANFTRAYLSRHGDLKIIIYKSRAPKTPDLPSWTPDFDSSADLSVLDIQSVYFEYNTSLFTRAILAEPGDWSELRLGGIICDTIQDLVVSEQSSTPATADELDWFMKCVTMTEQSYTRGDYSLIETLLKTMVMAGGKQVKSGNDTSPADPWLKDHLRQFSSYLARNSLFGSRPFPENEEELPSCFSARFDDLASGREHKSSESEPSTGFANTLRRCLSTASFFSTVDGRIGLGQLQAQRHDKVCVLPGLDVPVILRPVQHHHVLIGDCYVLDMMQGSMIREAKAGKRRLKEITIR